MRTKMEQTRALDAASVENINKNRHLGILRQRISQMERLGGAGCKKQRNSLSLFAAVDRLWPENGLPTACLHEVRGHGLAGHSAATTFVAALGGRMGRLGHDAAQRKTMQGHVLWCARKSDAHGTRFYAPGLAQVGLPPSRLLAVEASTDTEVLALMEEGLRHSSLACVIGEVEHLSLVASRRLQLAAEKSGVSACVARLPPRSTDARNAKSEPIAAVSRWRVTVLPSTPEAIAESGRARWQLELFHSRMGATGQWIVEAPDAQGHLHLSSALGDEFAQAAVTPQRRMAAG
jgi:protein ImuA